MLSDAQNMAYRGALYNCSRGIERGPVKSVQSQIVIENLGLVSK